MTELEKQTFDKAYELIKKNKQIEEIKKVLASDTIVWGRGEVTDSSIAEALYTAGYRKASDVAREVFEKIEEGIEAAICALRFNNNPIHRNAKHEAYSSLMCFIKTIEEEYTEEGQ